MAFKTDNVKLKKIIQFPKQAKIIKLVLDLEGSKLVTQTNLGFFELTKKSYVQFQDKNGKKCLKRRIMLNELFMSNVDRTNSFKVSLLVFDNLRDVGLDILKKDFIKEYNRLENLFKTFKDIIELGDF